MKSTFVEDLRTICSMACAPAGNGSHAERLEWFYARQAKHYDTFRKHLLQGRRRLFQSIPVPDDGVWVDMGGGTASNLEFLGGSINKLKKVYVVDLAPSLLSICE